MGMRAVVPSWVSAGWLRLLVQTIVFIVAVGIAVPAARAAECPNEQLRQRQLHGSQLPDCRAYEQVSPVQKNLTDALGEPGLVQAAPSGEALSFFSIAPFPGTVGSGGQVPTYLSARDTRGDAWLTDGLLPGLAPGSIEQVVGLTEDLAETVLVTQEPSETAPETRNAYVEDNATGSLQLLAANIGQEKLSFVDATPGAGRILFETTAHLPTTNVAPAPGVTNLYEWNEGKPPGERVSLAGVLPGGEAPAGGSVAGPGGPAIAPLQPGGSASEFYTQNTISEDGARTFFTDVATGIIYMREPQAERTVQVSAGNDPAYWRAATPNGSFVFYTKGEALYRYDVERAQREALTTSSPGTLGTLGISDDGSYLYFVATAKLADDTNGNGEAAQAGADNLYLWHEEAAARAAGTTFIARLGPNTELNQDEPDWRGYNYRGSEPAGPSDGQKSSRVAPDGKTVLFSSVSRLTSYDNAGRIELYLYDTDADRVSCVSCNPSATPALESAHLTNGNLDLAAAPTPRNASLTHNLSSDGDRVFFQTEEALVTQDTNTQLDVYEWERGGAGSCDTTSTSFSRSSDGCLYLISTGQSDQPSYFGDASADGDNVFFFTRQSLVSQDEDLNVDVYDARVDGGNATQNPPPPQAPCSGETSCRPAPDPPPPSLGAPSSATTLGGDGNLAEVPVVKPKPLTRTQKLTRALRACSKQPRKRRRTCRARAKKRYAKTRTGERHGRQRSKR
jgi:hypothetical protein